MNRRASDRLKVIIGSSLLIAFVMTMLGDFIGRPLDRPTALIFAAIGALFGVIVNMEEP